MTYTITIDDSYDFISSESSLFALDELYDEIQSGLDKSDLISDAVDTYMSLEADGDFIDTIIKAAKAIVKHIWKMVKFLFNGIKRIFLIVSRHIISKKFIDNMKTIGDVYDFLARFNYKDDAVASLARWVRALDNQFMWTHLGILFTDTIVEIRDSEAKENFKMFNDFLDEEKDIVTHGEYINNLHDITDYTIVLCKYITKEIIGKRERFMYERTKSSTGMYYQLDKDDWLKLRDIARNVEPKLDSVKSFVHTINNTIDRAISITNKRIERIMAEIDEFEEIYDSGVYSPQAERELREKYDDLNKSCKILKTMVDTFNSTKDTYVKGIHSHVDKNLGDNFPLGFQMVLEYSDSALKHIIESLRYMHKVEGQVISDSVADIKNQASMMIKDKAEGKSTLKTAMPALKSAALSAHRGVLREEQYKQFMAAKPVRPPHHPWQQKNYKPESVMFNLLFTPNMIPEPSFDVNSFNDTDLVYESSNLNDLICEAGYLDVTMPYSHAMEDVGLDIRKDSDFKSFKTQLVGDTNVMFSGSTDDKHPITSSRMSKRRAMIITSIKLMIESFNSIRDSLMDTVVKTRSNLDSYNETVTDREETSVEIPATLVKSIYSHNYNKIIELMAENEALRLDGEIDTKKIDVKELDRRLTSLVRNRNVYLSEKQVTVKLDDVLRTLRGKLAAFECILAKATIKPLATKIPTTQELEEYQNYLISLISLLKTDIIGTIIACNNITMEFGGAI